MSGNGTNKLIWWLLGILVTLVMGLSAGWAANVDKELDTLPQIRSEQAAATSDRASLQRQLNRMEQTQDRIEDKLDRIIERAP